LLPLPVIKPFDSQLHNQNTVYYTSIHLFPGTQTLLHGHLAIKVNLKILQTIPQFSVQDRVEKAVMEAATSNVLLIENDNQLAQLIAQELSCEGYNDRFTMAIRKLN
jgi:hypothetical protein